MVNYSKTTWILATNALVKRIIDFVRNNAIFDEDNLTKRESLLKELTSAIRKDFECPFHRAYLLSNSCVNFFEGASGIKVFKSLICSRLESSSMRIWYLYYLLPVLRL